MSPRDSIPRALIELSRSLEREKLAHNAASAVRLLLDRLSSSSTSSSTWPPPVRTELEALRLADATLCDLMVHSQVVHSQVDRVAHRPIVMEAERLHNEIKRAIVAIVGSAVDLYSCACTQPCDAEQHRD